MVTVPARGGRYGGPRMGGGGGKGCVKLKACARVKPRAVAASSNLLSAYPINAGTSRAPGTEAARASIKPALTINCMTGTASAINPRISWARAGATSSAASAISANSAGVSRQTLKTIFPASPGAAAAAALAKSGASSGCHWLAAVATTDASSGTAAASALTTTGKALGMATCAALMISLARASLSPGFACTTIAAAFAGHSGRRTLFHAARSKVEPEQIEETERGLSFASFSRVSRAIFRSLFSLLPPVEIPTAPSPSPAKFDEAHKTARKNPNRVS